MVPMERTLLDGNRSIKRGQLILDDVMTSEDFELTFDLTAKGYAGAGTVLASIFLMTITNTAYGHPGDRMPSFMFNGGTTKMIVYMGHPAKHNADCAVSE